MREIKFRAWDKKRGNWIDLSMASVILAVEERKMSLRNAFFGDITDTTELMQFTGLKDKNGKEIYEEDIVKVLGAFVDEEYSLFLIEFFECGFVSKWIYGVDGIDRTGKLADMEFINKENFFENCEVIGNKFENSELLKSEIKSALEETA